MILPIGLRVAEDRARHRGVDQHRIGGGRVVLAREPAAGDDRHRQQPREVVGHRGCRCSRPCRPSASVMSLPHARVGRTAPVNAPAATSTCGSSRTASSSRAKRSRSRLRRSASGVLADCLAARPTSTPQTRSIGEAERRLAVDARSAGRRGRRRRATRNEKKISMISSTFARLRFQIRLAAGGGSSRRSSLEGLDRVERATSARPDRRRRRCRTTIAMQHAVDEDARVDGEAGVGDEPALVDARAAPGRAGQARRRRR